jgi:two-component system sensor histidine kinase KdpD
LRELALKEVAGQVVRKVDTQVHKNIVRRHERILACIGSNGSRAKSVIRKTARLAGYYSGEWFILYVQTPGEDADKIALDRQRALINNFKLATELGGTIIRVQSRHVPMAIIAQAKKLKVTTVCIGKPHLSLMDIILSTGVFNELLKQLSSANIDLIILS